MKELLKKQKKIRFIVDGASHQNGTSECAIKTLFNMYSTILIHTELIFPLEILSNNLCPMVMDYAVWIYNRIPDIHSVRSAIDQSPKGKYFLLPPPYICRPHIYQT